KDRTREDEIQRLVMELRVQNSTEPLPHLAVQGEDSICCLDIDRSLCVHGLKEKYDPSAPVAIGGNGPHSFYVFVLMLFKVSRNKEVRLTDDPQLPEHQGNEHAPNPAIAIFKRMKSLKLHMRQGDADERTHFAFAHEPDQFTHGRGQMFRSYRNVVDFSSPIIADIVLLNLVGT